jgi:hypothetical protein
VSEACQPQAGILYETNSSCHPERERRILYETVKDKLQYAVEASSFTSLRFVQDDNFFFFVILGVSKISSLQQTVEKEILIAPLPAK